MENSSKGSSPDHVTDETGLVRSRSMPNSSQKGSDISEHVPRADSGPPVNVFGELQEYAS